jgi:hypothetical protein
MFRKNRLLAATVVIALVAAVMFSPIALPEAQADYPMGHFAAIAYSQLTGQYGYASRANNLTDAEANAVANCGAADAQVVAWVQNGWAAFARSSDGRTFNYGVSGRSLESAQNMALRGVERHGNGGILVAWAASE